jgi:subtilisin family serine protease
LILGSLVSFGLWRRVFATLGFGILPALALLGFSPQSAGGALIEASANGSGVSVYVIDSGIRSTHHEFGGRVKPGVTFVDDGLGTEDCTGHGTHVAGIVGGATAGVATGVDLVPVRVINCRGVGSIADVVAGIDWVAQHHVSPAVASFSLTAGSRNVEIDQAVRRAIDAGVVFVVSAGNDDKDACDVSPARVPGAVVVGSVDVQTQARAADSNWGECVSLFAPGVSVRSAWNDSDVSMAHDSGTSMASPFVAGLAAQHLQVEPGASPSDIARRLRFDARVDLVAGEGPGSPNLLAVRQTTG